MRATLAPMERGSDPQSNRKVGDYSHYRRMKSKMEHRDYNSAQSSRLDCKTIKSRG